MTTRQLQRSSDKQLFGVAAGIAEYFNLDTTIVRALFLLFTLLGGPGIIAYIVLTLLMPESASTAS